MRPTLSNSYKIHLPSRLKPIRKFSLTPFDAHLTRNITLKVFLT